MDRRGTRVRIIFEFELDADPGGDTVRSSALPEVKGNEQWQENAFMDHIHTVTDGASSSLIQMADDMLEFVRAKPKPTLSSRSYRKKRALEPSK